MNRIGVIAAYEFQRHVFKRSFVVVLAIVPVLALVIVGLAALSTLTAHDYTPVGYVDQAGFLGADPLLPPLRAGATAHDNVQQTVPIVAFASEAEARQALDAGTIQAFYVLPLDYPADQNVRVVYTTYPRGIAEDQFWDFLQLNLLARHVPETDALRAVAGSSLVIRTRDGSQEISDANFLGQFLPLLAGIALLILMLISSGYLMQIVATEKENRTMEVLITSVGPGRLITGKLLGVIGITLLTLLVWVGSVALLLGLASQGLDLPMLRSLAFVPGTWLALLAVLIPTFLLLAGLMIILGVAVVDPQEANAVGPLLLLVFEIPYLLIIVFVNDPNGPLAVALTLFPVTALQTLSLRMALTAVPLEQIVASVVVLFATGLGSIWLAGRVLRIGMLRYGQRLRLREIFGGGDAALREGGSS